MASQEYDRRAKSDLGGATFVNSFKGTGEPTSGITGQSRSFLQNTLASRDHSGSQSVSMIGGLTANQDSAGSFVSPDP